MLDMYSRFCLMRGLKPCVLLDENGHGILKVTGCGCWGAFSAEPGKHVVQRVPPTERSGRRQTSIVSVAVLPLPPERSLEPLRGSDIEVICQTGKQGAGGQNVNKVASAVRMKHIPTGISVFINGRDQGQNRREALHILTARVNEQTSTARSAEFNRKRKDQMRGQGGTVGGRGDKVRTYNFIDSRVVDHRLDTRTSNIRGVMKGDLSLILR